MTRPITFLPRAYKMRTPAFPLRAEPDLAPTVFGIEPTHLQATIGYRSGAGTMIVPPRTPVYPLWGGFITEVSHGPRGVRIVVKHRWHYTTVYDGIMQTQFYGLGVCRVGVSEFLPIGFVGGEEDQALRPLYFSIRWSRKPARRRLEVDPREWLPAPKPLVLQDAA